MFSLEPEYFRNITKLGWEFPVLWGTGLSNTFLILQLQGRKLEIRSVEIGDAALVGFQSNPRKYQKMEVLRCCLKRLFNVTLYFFKKMQIPQKK